MDIAKLALEDGTVYTGRAIGARVEVDGEVVFNTGMTGYQEVLTDPAYHGLIVTMTYPLIGNTGVGGEDIKNGRPWVRGLVIRELSRLVSNHRATDSLEGYLQEHGVPGVEGIDTRAIARKTRLQGALKGILSSVDLDDASLIARAKASPGLAGRDLVSEVMPRSSTSWLPGLDHPLAEQPDGSPSVPKEGHAPHVLALDFGMKWDIARQLVASGCRVTIMPGNTPLEVILEQDPDGILLSGGPGDPAAVEEPVQILRALIRGPVESRGLPVLGIGLGHQLIGRALGAKTFKLRLGHRGANQPVRDLQTGLVQITTQNHGFAIDPATFSSDVEPTHVNLNDHTLEGMRHRRLPISGLQYHPDGSVGPPGGRDLFKTFRQSLGEPSSR